MTMEEQLRTLARRAKNAARGMQRASSQAKNTFLHTLAHLLKENEPQIYAANELDLRLATEEGLDGPRLDRLRITPKVLETMRRGCLEVEGFEDPVGSMDRQWMRPNGLLVGKMRIPLGLIAMIYEARPNVTIDAAILCLKAGNAVLLRGGHEALNSNKYLAELLQTSLKSAKLPEDAALLVTEQSHAAVTELCQLDEYIDVMIPRGGEGLVRAVTKAATMPVLKHFKGVCHAYIDSDCDLPKALEIVLNAKVQRPGVCNALECLLVHRDIAKTFLPMVAEKLAKVEFRACPSALPLLGENARPLEPSDLGFEFHDLILAVKVVADFDEAVEHIARYGSNHTEIICTNSLELANRFVREVDASMVGVNVSTRFNDGGELGLGAEIGISTSKLHAYGPMGIRELTTTKFVVLGEGQIRL